MTRAKQIEALIKQLERVRSRPGMYFGHTDPMHAGIFLAGFNAAVYALGLNVDPEQSIAIAVERGWKSRSTGFDSSMREAGLTDAQIVDELLALKIEELRWLASTRGRSGTAAPVDVDA